MILDGLNPEQRAAAEAVRGRVCILAGAGSGKTTTVTRRIAQQVATGAFAPAQILAVTFTDKAAGELRARLAGLGVEGVRASTFHSAALAQLRHFAPEDVGEILASKAQLMRQIGNGLPGAFRFRPAGDLATEIEWAKNRRIPPERYLASAQERTPPIPHDLMYRVYREYERRKSAAGRLDFEDLLARAIALYERDESAATAFRERYLAFTVDEYQDVNGLQQRLLELWLGARDDLCAVGDDYQSIYGFTGAGPEHLLAFSRQAQVFRLEENYRSTPEVLAFANRLVPRLGGAEKNLRSAAATTGTDPELTGFSGWEEEGARIVERIRALHRDGVPYEEQAVLVRTNARSADLEEVLHAAEIPFQGASLLDREGARSLFRRVRGARGPAGEIVRDAALSLGWEPSPPADLGEREQTRQSDLGRIVAIAVGLDDVSELRPELERRFGANVATGVHLLTLHRSKGLEWDAVFLPRLEEGELPVRRGDLDEERRLLYVGITRARRHLCLTWSGKPSRFLAELGATTGASRRRRSAVSELTPLGSALRTWRLERARADGVPAYVVFHDRTLAEIELARPATIGELAAVAGVGPAKLERYGNDVLAVLSG